MIQPNVLSIPKVLTNCSSSSDPSKELVQASRSWNIRFDELIEAYIVLYRLAVKPVFTRK